MDMFEIYMKRYGETGVQAILDNWERFAGVYTIGPTTLENRWMDFMHATGKMTQERVA